MITELYLKTTDPTISLTELLRQNIGMIIISILYHTFIYTFTLNLASYIFFGKILSQKINVRFIASSLIIMSFGYIGRHFEVKDIYNAYNKNMDKTRAHIDKLFITWIFLG
jgi:hypothetical protein